MLCFTSLLYDGATGGRTFKEKLAIIILLPISLLCTLRACSALRTIISYIIRYTFRHFKRAEFQRLWSGDHAAAKAIIIST